VWQDSTATPGNICVFPQSSYENQILGWMEDIPSFDASPRKPGRVMLYFRHWDIAVHHIDFVPIQHAALKGEPQCNANHQAAFVDSIGIPSERIVHAIRP
jgi:hypothetical protein